MKSPSEDKRPFCVVPVRAIGIKDMSAINLRVLAALGYHANRAGVCWPSLLTLVGITGHDEKTVLRALKWLEEAGLIRQLKPNDYNQKAGRWGMSNRYQVRWTEDAPVPTWEEVRDANLLQPVADQDPVEGSGVRGTEANNGQAAIMIRAFDQAIEAVIGVRPTRQPGDEAIAARLAAAGLEAATIGQITGRLQREAAASRRGLVSMASIETACTNAIRSDGICTWENPGDRP